ncbi:MAG: transketolase C-terminal domain-containing protein [Candidatus Omnitrophota bacterium]|nr:transketolase C-terminal domain-containing protein [Candidatus Omnitrophota bacterium]
MARTVAQTIGETTRKHLKENNGLLFGQCVTAVGWIGGTVPEMTEEEGIVELSMADVSGSGIAVGAALVGRRPIYVIRYQGFMWYNAAPLVNYAAKSKDMWNVPCPILIRSIAMEGGIGPVASASHHGLVMHMPGMPVCAPMTPGEWLEAWQSFMDHDDPLYISEHRRSFPIDYEMNDTIEADAKITLIAISATRLNALEAIKKLDGEGIRCDLIHLLWLKPFTISETMIASLKKTGLGLVLDSDFEISGPSRSIAHELMLKTSVPVHTLGLEDRSAGFAPHLDNGTPTVARILAKIRNLIQPG